MTTTPRTSLTLFLRLAAAAAFSLCLLPAVANTPTAAASHAQEAAGLVFTDSVLRAVSREVTIVAASPGRGLPRENFVRDSSGRFEAFTVPDSAPGVSGTVDRIFFTDRRARRTYEIRGLMNPHRPFDGLAFRPGGLLQFDRWAGPHSGVRYRVDLRRRRLVSARTFFDADYVERQRKGAR